MRPAVGHHFQKTASGTDVFLVFFEMRCQFFDLFGKQSHLDLRRASIFVMNLVFLDYILLFLSCKHLQNYSKISPLLQDKAKKPLNVLRIQRLLFTLPCGHLLSSSVTNKPNYANYKIERDHRWVDHRGQPGNFFCKKSDMVVITHIVYAHKQRDNNKHHATGKGKSCGGLSP